MYRFKSLKDYENKLDQLTESINILKKNKADAQVVVNMEALKLSYIIEKIDFERSVD